MHHKLHKCGQSSVVFWHVLAISLNVNWGNHNVETNCFGETGQNMPEGYSFMEVLACIGLIYLIEDRFELSFQYSRLAQSAARPLRQAHVHFSSKAGSSKADVWLTVRVDSVLCSVYLWHDFCSDSAFLCSQQSPINLPSGCRDLCKMWQRYAAVPGFATMATCAGFPFLVNMTAEIITNAECKT